MERNIPLSLGGRSRTTLTPELVQLKRYTDIYKHPGFWRADRNEVRPFVTVGKPTCGANYVPITDHKKRKSGIPPTNLVRFRPQTASNLQKSSPGSAHGRPSIAVDLK